MPVNLGKTPQNQLDALPLLSADAVSDPGDTVVIGGQLIRHWIPSRVGINGLNRVLYVNIAVKAFVGPGLPLDFSGMNSFTFALGKTVTAVAGDTNAQAQLYATQIGLGQSPMPFDTPDGTQGFSRMGSMRVDFGLMGVRGGGYPFTQYAYRGASNSSMQFGGTTSTLVGPGWYFWLDFSGQIAGWADEFWSLEIWAQS